MKAREARKSLCWERWRQRHEMSTWKMCNIKNKFTNVVYIKFFLLCYYDFRGSNLFSILAFSLAQLFRLLLTLSVWMRKAEEEKWFFIVSRERFSSFPRRLRLAIYLCYHHITTCEFFFPWIIFLSRLELTQEWIMSDNNCELMLFNCKKKSIWFVKF